MRHDSGWLQPAPPADLFSFPTRRSSDLARVRGARARAGAPARAARSRRDPAAARRAAERAVGAAGHEDRKSTRLNSSHMSISYAVFCLKKKTLRKASAPADGRSLFEPFT